MSMIVRAFLSIDIENQTILSRISQIQKKIDSQSAKMKMVESENIHFTIRFFGDILMTRIDQIEEMLKQVEIEPFEISIKGIGAFPSKRRPRVIWVGVNDNAHRIVHLKTEIDRILTQIGYEKEKERFTPHATIARVRAVKDSNTLANNLDSLADEEIGIMTVTSISMKKSTLTASGPIYETLWKIG